MKKEINFEDYRKIAEEVARETGDPFLVKQIILSYLSVYQNNTPYPVDSTKEFIIAEKTYKELEKLAVNSRDPKKDPINLFNIL